MMESTSNVQKQSSELIFFVNGRKIKDSNVDPEWSLLHYLRRKLLLPGTKLGCGEGGCGACTVMISKFDIKNDVIRHYSAHACLTLLVSLHGRSVTTVEGLGSCRDKLHPVQERIALAHGSQCGFCTPGFVMSMYALLRNNPKPSLKEIEENISGNLCRCTGYRPILEGFASFSSDSFKGCGKKDCCQLRDKELENELEVSEDLFDANEFQPYDPSQDIIFPPELKLLHDDYFYNDLEFHGNRVSYYQPSDISKLLDLKFEFPHSVITVGNTELAIDAKFKNKVHPVQLNPSRVVEMSTIEEGAEGIVVGAAVTLTELEEKLTNLTNKMPVSKTKIFGSMLHILKWFGSKQIKNVASLGGNLMNCSPISDLSPILFAARAKATLMSKGSTRTVSIDECFFTGYRKNLSEPEELLMNIFIPFTTETEYFRSFKQSRRKTDDLAIVNCAMKVDLNLPEAKVKDVLLVFGGMDNRLKEAKITREVLIGQLWDQQLLEAAVGTLIPEFELEASAPGGMARYRETLVISFFFKFYSYVLNELQNPHDKKNDGNDSYIQDPSCERPHASATQVFQKVSAPGIDPIGRPIVHSSGLHHSSGEATFTDDLPCHENELHAAPVMSTKAFAVIKNINYEKALKVEGVYGFFSAKDLSEERNKAGILVQDEELFASKEVRYVGHVIGVVVATSRTIARQAANEVQIDYEEKTPIITIEDAIDKNSIWKPITVESGDVEKGFEAAANLLEGTIRMGGQEHFYMEPQTTQALPSNDGEMHIFCATQYPTETQKNVANALGLPLNRVVCKAKRLGGAFGGKEVMSGNIASYAALAAYKLKRPVRMVLDRDEDMMITGGRHPVLAKWKVGFNNDGTLVSLEVNMFMNAGYSLDLSDGVVATRAILHADNVYSIPNIRISCTSCRTNLASNTVFRGAGAPQSMFFMEDVLTRVGSFLQLDQYQVRHVNMFKTSNPVTYYGQLLEFCTIKSCWDQVVVQARYEERLQKVNDFNTKNAFMKRGISVVPCKMAISFGIKSREQAGALVLIYKDGSVLLSHAGVEMGQGLHIKMIQIASRVLEIPVESIYISETSTSHIPNASPTAGSLSSDVNGMAVKEACEKLKERLAPYQKCGYTWLESINKAFLDRIPLSATGFFATPGLIDFDFSSKERKTLSFKTNPYNYFTYGAAVTEIEIDTLTGSHTVLQTDIVMDVGQSLNPAIDIGQIEGAFLMGYGLFVLEEHQYSPQGQLLTVGPSNYKIPSVHDIPRKFNVSLLRGSSNPRAVYSSRGIGEPPLFLAASVFYAIKEAVRATRKGMGPFRLDSPATSERIRMACQDHLVQKVPGKKHVSAPWSINV